MLGGENGIITKAHEATQEWEETSKDEQKNIEDTSDYIDSYFKQDDNNSENLKWEEIKDEEGNVVEIKNKNKIVQIGDYIYYNPLDGATEFSYVSNSSQNGYAQQKFTLGGEESSYNCDIFSWKVLGADQDGNLLIVSEDIVKSISGGYQNKFSMRGKNAFESGLNELDNICRLFGQGYGAIDSRCIEMDDISKLIGFKPTTGKINYYWGGNNNIYYQTDYNNSYSNSGILGNSHDFFSYYDFTDKMWKKVLPSETATSENREWIVTLDGTSCDYRGEGLDTESKVARMIFNGNELQQLEYWLGNKCIVASNVSAECSFLTVKYLYRMPNMISTNSVYSSNDKSTHWAFYVRPVITIDKQIELFGSSEEGWKIKK